MVLDLARAKDQCFKEMLFLSTNTIIYFFSWSKVRWVETGCSSSMAEFSHTPGPPVIILSVCSPPFSKHRFNNFCSPNEVHSYMVMCLISLTSFSNHIHGFLWGGGYCKMGCLSAWHWEEVPYLLPFLQSSPLPGPAMSFTPPSDSSQLSSNFIYPLEASGITLAAWSSLSPPKSVLPLGAGKKCVRQWACRRAGFLHHGTTHILGRNILHCGLQLLSQHDNPSVC